MRARLPELSLSLIAALVALVVTYAAARIAQASLWPEPNPALVVWSTRIAMYWRVAIGAYVGSLVAPVVFLLARRDLARVARGLSVAVLVAAALLALQTVAFP